MNKNGEPSNESAYGGLIIDDKRRLSMDTRGMLAMVSFNQNKWAAGSMFFVSFGSCRNLQRARKMVGIGTLVAGSETLEIIEKLEVDKKDMSPQRIPTLLACGILGKDDKLVQTVTL